MTKVIHFSEPHRLIQSESENLGVVEVSNSDKSLRISILSNKSEDLEVNKNKIQLYKLQRTRKMNRLSSLITSGVLDDFKYQSQTINLTNIFASLLDDNNNDLNKFIPKITPPNHELIKNKIFEYRPQEAISQKSNQETDEVILENQERQKISRQSSKESELDINTLDKVIDKIMEDEAKEELELQPSTSKANSADFQADQNEFPDAVHHRQSSSNSNIGIKK